MREMYFCYWHCLWNSLQVLEEKHAIIEAGIQKALLKNDHNVVPLPDSTSCVDVHGRLRKDVLHSCLYELPHALCSCILATNKIFGYCQQRKVLQRFIIPEVHHEQTTLIPWWQFYFVFLALHLTASHVLYRVVKSPLMCRKQFTLYQRWRQGAIFWALHFYSSHHIKPGWQQLAGMDCSASVRFQQWYCLLKPLSTSSSMFMSTGLGATCFSENAQISEEYVNRHTFWHAGQVCAAAVPLMLAGWSWICLFHPRQSDPHHHWPEGRLARLQQAKVSSRVSKNIKRTNITIELAIFSFSGNFKMPLKLDLKHFCFYNAFRLKLSGAGKANAATQFGQSIADSFESVVSSENTVLTNMTDWDSQTQSFTRCSSFYTGEV